VGAYTDSQHVPLARLPAHAPTGSCHAPVPLARLPAHAPTGSCHAPRSCIPIRLNTAITRAASMLLIVGDENVLAQDTVWNQLLTKLKAIGAFVPAAQHGDTALESSAVASSAAATTSSTPSANNHGFAGAGAAGAASNGSSGPARGAVAPAEPVVSTERTPRVQTHAQAPQLQSTRDQRIDTRSAGDEQHHDGRTVLTRGGPQDSSLAPPLSGSLNGDARSGSDYLPLPAVEGHDFAPERHSTAQRGFVGGPSPAATVRTGLSLAAEATPFQPSVSPYRVLGSGLFVPTAVPLTASALASASGQELKQMLGERLFPLVSALYPELASKITGMLLEMDNSDLLDLLEDNTALTTRVQVAFHVLESAQRSSGLFTSTPNGLTAAMGGDGGGGGGGVSGGGGVGSSGAVGGGPRPPQPRQIYPLPFTAPHLSGLEPVVYCMGTHDPFFSVERGDQSLGGTGGMVTIKICTFGLVPKFMFMARNDAHHSSMATLDLVQARPDTRPALMPVLGGPTSAHALRTRVLVIPPPGYQQPQLLPSGGDSILLLMSPMSSPFAYAQYRA
jgi:hypothetical protein